MLTVSERSKRDLVELYGLTPDAVDVTPNGVDPVVLGPGDTGIPRTTCSPSVSSSRARTSSPRSTAAQEVGLPLVVAGPAKDEALARRAAQARRRRCAGT